MDKLQTLLAQLAKLDEQIDTLLAGEELTQEQQTEHDTLVASRQKTITAIQREQDRLLREEERDKLEAIASAQAERINRTAIAGTGRLTDADKALPPAAPLANHGHRKYTIPASVKRWGGLKNFRGTIGGVDAETRAYRFGQWGLAMLAMQLPGRYAHIPHFKEALSFYETEFVPQQQAAANYSGDAYGTQYLIPPEFSRDIIVLREQFGLARRLFKVEPMGSDTRNIPRRKGGLTAYFVAQPGAGTESNANWDNVQLVAKQLMVLSRYQAQVAADAIIPFGDDLAGEISYAFAMKEDDCAFNGDGGAGYGTIKGVRTLLVSCDGVTGHKSAGLVTQATGNTWGAIVLQDFLNMAGKLPRYAANPAWITHNAFYYDVMLRLELAAGGVQAFEVRMGDASPRPLFLGYPVEISQIWPSADAVATVICALGAWDKVGTFGDRQQDSVAFSEHATIGGENLFERNQIGIRGIERFDIQVHDVGTQAVVGPVVGLTTGAGP